MSPPREEKLFELALEKPSEERTEFLDAVCGDDSGVRRRVEALLAASDEETGFLPGEGTTEASPTLLDESELTEETGAQIGRYKLLEKLGEGGFGSVWAAEQKEPVRRRVALKIIKLGMDTKQVVARFEAERQALALMDHPNIAKVLDAGATDTGRPYFVMELVKGMPITKYCNQEKLDTQARLDLFIKVCQAIQHAHQKGIIHRDIKPSNIMVTLHDGVPVPKVIDFGIAKATQQELTEKTIYTQYSQFIGTPAYMSPEQAEMSGLDIDTRSDIYSLGVLLYELLTGTTPFDTKELMQSGLDEMRKIIREREPVRPSTRLSQTQESVPSKIINHKSKIENDLDWIVMKCLEKDRTRRYDTAKGLASDINRHLSNEPIMARPPSAIYKFQKSWRRNKLAYGAAMIVFAALVGAVVVSGMFALREHNAKQAESAERLRATAAEQAAVATADRNFKLSYMADVNLAHQIIQSGDFARATSILERYLPERNQSGEDVRGFGWHYLWSQSRERSVRALPHQGIVKVAFSPDGRTFATGASDGLIQVRDTMTQEKKMEFEVNPQPFDQFQSIHPVYSPRGGVIAGLSRNSIVQDSGRVTLCDIETGSKWSLASSSPNSVVQFTFGEDGETIMTAERNGQIREWDMDSGQPLGEPRQLAADARWQRAAFSPDLRLLAAGARTATPGSENSEGKEPIEIHVYDLETGRVKIVLATQERTFDELKFTEDNRFLVGTGWSSPKSFVWDLETGEEAFSLSDISGVSGIAAVSPQTVIIGGSDSIYFLDPESGKETERWKGIPGIVFGLAVSPDGKHLASAGWDGVVRLWDLPRRKNPISVRLDGPEIRSLSVSPSGRLVAAERDGAVILWDSVDFEAVQTFSEQRQPVFSPAGGRLATVSRSGDTIRIWNTQSGQPEDPPISSDGNRIAQIAFSKDGRLIACANADGSVLILEIASRRIQRRISAHSHGGVRYVAFGANSAGDALLAISWGPRTVKLLNLADDTEKILEGSTPVIRGVAFSPDGSHLASIGSTAIIWNTETGQRELAIEELTSEVAQVIFTPDGKSLLIHVWGGGLGLWDLETGREKIRLLQIYRQRVSSVALSPDGNRILAGTDDDTLMIWTATRK